MKLKFIKNRKDLRGSILGTMLGDGYIRHLDRYESTKKGTFRFTHSLEQEDYLDFKKNLLELHPNVVCKKTYRDITLKNGKTYKQCELTTNSNKYASFIGNKIYKNKIKTINMDLLNELTDLGLFLWYLDDGYLNIRRDKNTGKVKEYRVFLYTNCFTLEEVQTIKLWFEKRYNISPNINRKEKKHENRGYILYFNASKTRDLMKIFDPYKDLIDSMKRKILEYVILP